MSRFFPFTAGHRLAIATALCAAALAPGLAGALPLNFGTGANNNPISARWPNNTVIHVYIPTPPTPPGSCGLADAKAGIQRWAAALAQRGITVQFHDNQSPPPGAPNAVGVQWVPDGTLGENNDGYGEANAVDQTGGAVITSGGIKVETDVACGEYLRNIFMHEFGHVLGLADDETPEGAAHNAMDHNVPDTGTMGFSGRDSSEMKTLYGCFTAAPPFQPKGALQQSVTPVGDPPSLYRYDYAIEWHAGPGIVTFDVSLGVARSAVTVLDLPPGWHVAEPPFYLDCYATPPATEDTRELHFYTHDDGISETNPLGHFLIESSAIPAPGWALPLIDPEDDGTFPPLPAIVPGMAPTGVGPAGGGKEDAVRWLAPRPNPFRAETRLRFAAASAWRDGRVEVYDLNGRLLRTLDPGRGRAGEIEVPWDGRTSAGDAAGPGAYFVRVTLDGVSVKGAVVLAR